MHNALHPRHLTWYCADTYLALLRLAALATLLACSSAVNKTPCFTAGTPSHVGAGSVQIDSSAKPLVPYPVGISGQGPARQPSRSRLASIAKAEEGMKLGFTLPLALPSARILYQSLVSPMCLI